MLTEGKNVNYVTPRNVSLGLLWFLPWVRTRENFPYVLAIWVCAAVKVTVFNQFSLGEGKEIREFYQNTGNLGIDTRRL